MTHLCTYCICAVVPLAQHTRVQVCRVGKSNIQFICITCFCNSCAFGVFVYYVYYCVQVMCEMGDNEVKKYTPSQRLLPHLDSGVGVTAESTPCTQDIQQGEEHDDVKVICADNRLCPTTHYDAEEKQYVIGCHQETCIHTEHREEARGESTTDESNEKLPVECSDKCHQGVLVVSPRF